MICAFTLIYIWLGILWAPSVNTDICEIEFISRGEKTRTEHIVNIDFYDIVRTKKYIYSIPHHLPFRNFHTSNCRRGTQD